MSLNAMPKARRRSFLVVLMLGVLATVAAATAFTPAMSGFTASINNTSNTVGTGTLTLSETQAAVTCLSSASGTVTAANAGTCSTINKFGGNTTAVPGAVTESTVTLQNTGTLTATTFTLTPSACVQSNNGPTNGTATDLCSKVNLTIQDTTATKCVLPASASACAAPTNTVNLASIGTTAIALPAPLAPGASKTFKFSVQVDNSVTNAYQGLAANVPLTWAVSAS